MDNSRCSRGLGVLQLFVSMLVATLIGGCDRGDVLAPPIKVDDQEVEVLGTSVYVWTDAYGSVVRVQRPVNPQAHGTKTVTVYDQYGGIKEQKSARSWQALIPSDVRARAERMALDPLEQARVAAAGRGKSRTPPDEGSCVPATFAMASSSTCSALYDVAAACIVDDEIDTSGATCNAAIEAAMDSCDMGYDDVVSWLWDEYGPGGGECNDPGGCDQSGGNGGATGADCTLTLYSTTVWFEGVEITVWYYECE